MKRWRVEGEPGEEVVAAVAEVLLGGGIAILPTDTIYGLHALADSPAAARIADLKGRGDDKPFVVIAASAGQLRTFGADVPAALEQIWPAPLTAVLRRGGSTVAARVPDLAWLRALLMKTGPLVSTSANRSGEPPVSSIAELAREMAESIEAGVDAGPLRGKPSTIVDFTFDIPRILREGDAAFTQFLRKTLRISL